MDYFDWYATYLHRTCTVADGHRDLVTEIYRRRLDGERGVFHQLYKKEFVKSGVNLIIASLFLGADELEDCKAEGVFRGGAVLKKAMEMLAAFFADIEETKGRVELVTDRESLLRITAKRGFSRRHRVGVLLYLEGLDMLEGEPELLRCFYAMGVRGAALTWNVRRGLPNPFAEGCGGSVKSSDDGMPGPQGITEKGVEALLLMEKLGIFVDSSHLSREAAGLLSSFTKKPFAATHSNAAALCGHERNLTDEEIKRVVLRGGVIGVNGYGKFHCLEGGRGGGQNAGGAEYAGREKSGIDALCDQILYLVETAGEDYVGFGIDLGDGNLLADYRELPMLSATLLRRGVSAETVKKVLGANWVRYLSQVI